MTKDRIERDVLINAPVERVWALITRAEHLGTWFGDAGAEIDLREGGELELRWVKHGACRGRIERVDEPTAFAFRWSPYTDPGGAEPVNGNSTLVEFTLVEEGDATRVRVVETGFASLDTSPDQQAKNYQANSEGWSLELGELADYATRVRM
ncbi:MAG: SRPBCC family protein [Thermoleophilaceae bacterium]